MADFLLTWLSQGEEMPPPTPEEARTRLLTRCGQLFRALNEAGYRPKWTATTITTYVNEKFMVKDGTDALNLEDLQTLVADLSAKLDTQNAQNSGERTRAAAAGVVAEEEDEF